MRPDEYVIRESEEHTFYMQIEHKKTGVLVNGKGSNKYQLECDLLQALREKLERKNGERRT